MYSQYSGSELNYQYPREHMNSGYMTLKQAEHYLDKGKRLNLARKFVSGAIENIQKVLTYYANRGKPLSEIIDKIDSIKKQA